MGKHVGFVSSPGPDTDGWYALVEDNEIIRFRRRCNTLNIEAEMNIAIKVNNNPDLWYVKAGYPGEGIDDLMIEFIQILAPAGTKVKWKGLY